MYYTFQNCSYLERDGVNIFFTRKCSCGSYVDVFFHVGISLCVPVDKDQIYKTIEVLTVTESLVKVRDVKAPSVFTAYVSD